MSDDTPPLAGILGRVSKDTSGDERSIAEQQDENRAECADHGWSVAAEYEDAVGASRFTRQRRQDWPRLLADIEAGRLGVVVMWESSRGSREPEDWFGFLRRCRQHRVLIHVTNHGRTYDMAVARDWKTLAEDGVQSAYEVEQLSDRIKRSLAANRVNGKPHGRTLYGYERIYRLGKNKKGKTVRQLAEQRPHPERAAVCSEIIRRAAQAEPVSAIQADLNRRGVASAQGQEWSRHQVRSVAMNPAYIGKLRDGAGLVDAIWPAIVDEETFWAAQQYLSAPERKTSRPGKAAHLLSCIMTCAKCGAQVNAILYGQRRPPAYVCARPSRHCVSVPMAAADRFVTAVVLERCQQPDIWARVVEGSDEQVIQARNEAARLRAELDEWAAADITARAYQIKEGKLLPLIKAAEQRAVELAVPLPLRELAEPGADVRARWEGLSVAARREVVRLLLAPVELHRAVAGGVRLPAEDRITFAPRPMRTTTASGSVAAAQNLPGRIAPRPHHRRDLAAAGFTPDSLRYGRQRVTQLAHR